MFSHVLNRQASRHDFVLILLCMIYTTMIISSIVLFGIILKLNLFGIRITLPGSVVPYVFLYPISFIILRVYGIECINNTIGSAILATLMFVILAKLISSFSSNNAALSGILSSSFQMYLAGFIGMPAGMYVSFLVINIFTKLGFSFNTLLLAGATAVGEIVNTIIVFPIGLRGTISMNVIFHEIIADALIFKITAGTILAFASVIIINILIDKKISS